MRRVHPWEGWTLSEETTDVGSQLDVEPGHVGGVIAGALVIALYAAWMAADLAARWITFPIVAILAGYFLFQRENSASKLTFIGYAIGGLLIITPLFFILPEIFSGFETALMTRAFGLANLLLVIVFVIPGAIIAYATYRYDGGKGVLARVRDRFSDRGRSSDRDRSSE